MEVGADVNEWSYNFTPPYALMVWCSVKHRDNSMYYAGISG
jgi:hypothetical protein